eukprot:TRINITY_DN33029_c0_g1_i1.p1 TRINITY_DN33029_c0_g1~~TRINITY_DN33029_c0_g1_i1.p1  ORF type:complete len:386 (+),score=101.39 TRINITY_DN33029_c0_g1_i1:82-1158(+)
MRQRPRLDPLELPQVSEKIWRNEMRLSAEIIETLVAANKDADTNYPPRDLRARFVGGVENKPPVTKFVKQLGALCPKTWPAVLYLVDQASRAGKVAVNICTVYRLLTAATYLVLSSEGEDAYSALAVIHSTSLPRVEALGKYLERLLRKAQKDVNPAATEWDEFVGLNHVGWIRAELPRHARDMQRAHARRLACTHSCALQKGGGASVPSSDIGVIGSCSTDSPDVPTDVSAREPMHINLESRTMSMDVLKRTMSLSLRTSSLISRASPDFSERFEFCDGSAISVDGESCGSSIVGDPLGITQIDLALKESLHPTLRLSSQSSSTTLQSRGDSVQSSPRALKYIIAAREYVHAASPSN